MPQSPVECQSQSVDRHMVGRTSLERLQVETVAGHEVVFAQVPGNVNADAGGAADIALLHACRRVAARLGGLVFHGGHVGQQADGKRME
jgi:hypothetical protein